MVADQSAQLAALGSDLERTQRRLRNLEQLVRVLADDVAALTAEEASGGTGDRSWLLLADADQSQAVLADLTEWLAQVYLHYPDTALPSCWLWHPAVVEELWWLRQAHRDAYSSKAGSPAKVADWHDRQRPGVVKRIKTVAGNGGCELALHEQARPAPAVPLVGSVDRIADTWTRAKTSPQPTPDEITEAEHHDHQQNRSTHR